MIIKSKKITASFVFILAFFAAMANGYEEAAADNHFFSFFPSQLTNNTIKPFSLETEGLISNKFDSSFSHKSYDLSIEDNAAEGKWLVSFDLNQAPHHQQNDIFELGTQLTLNNKSQLFVNYGSKKVPITISFDESLPLANNNAIQENTFQFGLNQNVNESWAVSISYSNASLELETPDFSFAGSGPSSHQFLFGFNENGQPENVNYIPQIAQSGRFYQDIEGIEIKVSRQVTDTITLGSSIQLAEGQIEQSQPFVFQGLGTNQAFDINSLSLYSDIEFNEQWSMKAHVEHQENQHFSMANSGLKSLNMSSTTLDIGLQYQTQWNQVGLVIRVDLVNLLGITRFGDEFNAYQDLDEGGLSPYTFQTPKYIKLSGSINF